MNLAMVKSAVTKTFSRSGLILKKYSPEILLVVGIGSGIGATIMACKATLKVEEILDEHKETMDTIDEIAEQKPELYSEDDRKKDTVKVYIRTGKNLFKEFAPAIGLGAGSITCILASHGIMKTRNVALMAAYNAVDEAFKAYRTRVIEEEGTDADLHYRHGVTKETVAEQIEEDGKKKKVKKEISAIDPDQCRTPSQYARFFDESSTYWKKCPEMNLLFLRSQQNYANDMLKCQGHLFLNEVYDLLGIPRSKAGAVVGWVLGKDGDNYVDFGIYDLASSKVRDFVNGYERSILLDFNVDGVIYDLI